MDEFSFKKASRIVTLAILIIATSLIFSGFIFSSNGSKAKNIAISINGKLTQVETKANNIEKLFNEENIYIAEGSRLNVSLEDELKEDMVVRILTPKEYTIKIGDNISLVADSLYIKVRDVLKENNIVLEENDVVVPELNSTLISGDTIQINTLREIEKVVTKTIPFEDIVRNSSKLERGKTRVIQEGKNGKLKEYYKQVFSNGILEEETLLREEVVTEPIPKITERGTMVPKPAANRGGTLVTSTSKLNYSKVIVMQATAYHAGYESTGKRPGDKYYGITATGTRVRPGVVAVDPRVIPLGSKLYVESMDGTRSYGYAFAEDVGGGVKGNRIDLYHESYAAAMRFGRRNVRVYILN